MSQFEPAMDIVLIQEGPPSDDPDDAGGYTRFGLASAHHVGIDIQHISLENAKQIYMDEYWTPNHYDQIDDQDLANKAFSMCVNMGARSANKALQIAAGVMADGILGTKSFAAINAADPTELLAAFKDALWNHYEKVMAARPTNEKYRKGWRNRCYS